jgi:hypothetical protein
MHRGLVAAVAGAALATSSVLVAAAPAGASGLSIKVSPSTRLTNNQAVTITGSGLGRSTHGSIATWFASECTSKAIGVRSLDPDFSPHCAPLIVKALHVSPRGTFSAKFRVATGAVADDFCGTPGHLTCLIAVGTATGRHVTATIKFKDLTPHTAPTSTTKPAK